MVARAVEIPDWPSPDTVTPAILVAGTPRLLILYGTGEDNYAVVTFPSWCNVKSGGPNDEALSGHPLYGSGLRPYAIHRIENSPWLRELDRQNSVHPCHDSARFLQDKVHYLFALKEETIECIVRETGSARPEVEVFTSRRAALSKMTGGVDA